ncbi:MAG: phosphoglycerate mutase [Rhodoferax sp.]|uniref:phosphoglycerate mutase n=1 Tax=Rhodoferax sp. TaxID=50421 RepID=UPI001B5036A0|nr:phosphoglycerate mutase [Rhodoferax sp.]MBP9907012.1 phosphoglycerate mutase [Rhodoferax sp.]
MHLIIPFAASHAESGLAALRQLELPHLDKLLRRLQALPPEQGDALSLSPPHERVHARALGLPVVDGQIPWAALLAQQQPTLAESGQAWAFISLCHWHLAGQQVVMSPLPLPDLTEPESTAFLHAMQPYFAEDGIQLYQEQPGRWLAHGPMFADAACASLDRVVGCSLESWIPSSAQASRLRRLQNEMQMLLYTHPVNDARAQRGVVPVNSIWFSGTGALPTAFSRVPVTAQPVVVDSLRQAALAGDWPAWRQAWQALDAQQIADLLQTAVSGQPVHISLCGEHSSQCWRNGALPMWHRLKQLFGHRPISDVLSSL